MMSPQAAFPSKCESIHVRLRKLQANGERRASSNRGVKICTLTPILNYDGGRLAHKSAVALGQVAFCLQDRSSSVPGSDSNHALQSKVRLSRENWAEMSSPPAPSLPLLGQSPNNTPLRPLRVLRSQITFPKAEHFPARAAQRARHATIAHAVLLHFRPPKRWSGCRRPIMPGASMPKTAIDENRHSLRTKHKIRAARKALVPPPAGYCVRLEHPEQGKFGFLVVARTNSRHKLRAS
jgi:hypothetical protein